MNSNGKNKRDMNPQERIAYLESLFLLEQAPPYVDNTPVFLRHLDDEEPKVRATAIRGLWFAPSTSVLERLMEMAEQDPSPLVRAQAVSAMGIYMYEGETAAYDLDWGPMAEILQESQIPEADFLRAKAYLLGVYADETRSLDERRFAIESLGFLSDPKVADLIEEAYQRPEREMKISALFAMGRSGLKHWADIVGRELRNPDKDIQREAIRAAGEIGTQDLGEGLWDLTFDQDREVMLEALESLGQTGWEGGLERLEELTDDPDPEVAAVAAEALEEWLFMDELLSGEDDPDSDWEADDW